MIQLFDNNKSKDQYIKNKIEQEKYKKYIQILIWIIINIF